MSPARRDDAALEALVIELRRAGRTVDEITRVMRITRPRVKRILEPHGLNSAPDDGWRQVSDFMDGSARLLAAIRHHHPERCGA